MEKLAQYTIVTTVLKKSISKTEGLNSGCIRKYGLTILCLLLSFSLFAQNNLIEWEKDVKLTWDDFVAPPKQHSPFLAETDWSIKYSCNLENGELVFVVNCLFNPKLSWVKEEGRTDYLLAHEQAHFDIAEIYTRKLRKELSHHDYSKNSIQSSVQKMYYKAFNDCKKMQHQYDKETEHSVNRVAQDIWDIKIASMLEELKEYSGTNYTVPFPN